QAEDGIRDRTVTGVQTCALPIFFAAAGAGVRSRRQGQYDNPCGRGIALRLGGHVHPLPHGGPEPTVWTTSDQYQRALPVQQSVRSEERRVGKECRRKVWTQG